MNTMYSGIESNVLTAADVAIVLNEVFPDSSYGAIPASEQRDALVAYLAFDDGAFDEVPQALAAYINHQQRYSG